MKDKAGSDAAQSPAGKVGGEVLLLLAQERDTVVAGSMQVRVHAAAFPIDTTQSGGDKEADMKAFEVIP